MMRILFVSSSSGSQGGGEYYLVYLAEALKSMGHEVGLWLATDPQMDGIAKMFEPVGTVIRQDYKNTFLRKTRSFSHMLPNGQKMKPILSEWKAFNPDFLHLNKQCLEDGLDLLKAATTLNIPQGCTIHITQSAVELNAFLAPLRDKVARSILLKYPGNLWAIAQNRADSLKGFLGGKREIQYIANGVRIPNEEEMSEEACHLRGEYSEFLGNKGPVAVSVGRLEEQKDPFRFLDIVEEWKKQEPSLSALWVGDGRLREAFENRIMEMNAGDWIRCVGWQKNAGQFLSLADVYVHPARYEGLPFALLEAMAHGLPCVISPSLAEDLKDIPEDLWILATENPGDWLPQLRNKDSLEKLGKRSRAIAVEEFSLEAMASSYVDLYEKAIGKAKGQEL